MALFYFLNGEQSINNLHMIDVHGQQASIGFAASQEVPFLQSQSLISILAISTCINIESFGSQPDIYQVFEHQYNKYRANPRASHQADH